MWTLLRNLRLGSSRPADTLPQGQVGPASAASMLGSPDTVGKPEHPPGEPGACGNFAMAGNFIVRDFTACLLGVGALCDEEPTAAELTVLKRLDDAACAVGDEPLVPRLPSVLPKLMRLIRRDDMAGRELAALLEREPALLGEVMRSANSPRYRGTQALTSIDAAVALLGQRGLQEVVSRAVMTPVFNLTQGRFSAAAGKLLWDQAESCADACASLRRGTADHFDAYLAGMVANAGLIVALRVLDQDPASAPPSSVAFHDQLAALSARLSARIARHWQFPASVALAVEALSHPSAASEAGGLADALRLADMASKAQILAGTADQAGPARPGSSKPLPAPLAQSEEQGQRDQGGQRNGKHDTGARIRGPEAPAELSEPLR